MPPFAWFFHNATAPLDDPSAPLPHPSVPAASTVPIEKETNWQPFSPDDNARLEATWQALHNPRRTGPQGTGPAPRRGSSTKDPSARADVNVIVGLSRLYAVKFTPPEDEEDEEIERKPRRPSHSASGSSSPVPLTPLSSSLPNTDLPPKPESPELSPKRHRRERSSTPVVNNVNGLIGETLERQTSRSSRRSFSSSMSGSTAFNSTKTVSTAKLIPVYWNPMHDTAHVVRATWFTTVTRKRICPLGTPVDDDDVVVVPSAPIIDTYLVDQLEKAYLGVKPWSETYIAELNSVKQIGKDAESKLKVPVPGGNVIFWPVYNRKPADRHHATNLSYIHNRHQINRKYSFDEYQRPITYGDATFADSNQNRSLAYAIMISDTVLNNSSTAMAALFKKRKFSAEVATVMDALPTEINIENGSVSTKLPESHVDGLLRRGFDYDLWKQYLNTSGPGVGAQVNHLVLVVHGIGQKLSERVETFDFTYAINTFRVQMAKQQANFVAERTAAGAGAAPKCTTAVLPVNWRRKINFDYDDTTMADDGSVPVRHAYTLDDITPNTIPTVRNLISDVLLDIPYYLSKHRPRVLHAVVAEANRLYRLWCRNNPGFDRNGKVSVIGHSLGSVIAVDILSRQPTVPPPLFSQSDTLSEEAELHLEFQTKNLFLAGSPAGFFLLLNRTNLIPRTSRRKRDMIAKMNGLANGDQIDTSNISIDHGGVYGCIAAENVYNVIHTSDPIAYRLNPCVDADYAARIQRALINVPSGPSFISSMAATFSIGGNNAGKRVVRRAEDVKQAVINRATEVSNQAQDQALARVVSHHKGRHHTEAREPEPRPSRTPTAERVKKRSSMSSYLSGRSRSSSPEQPRRPRPVDAVYEQIVKNRFYMLNSNGQLDYVIQPTGALENQYISILTAHSGYWDTKEFAYLVGVETIKDDLPGGNVEELEARLKM
ncbi:DDHD domain-containing protein [Dipodascopsis tothii]|uniref:DDHD domain-containing protein n=1 Tax=Dipodascopsis tothii TaxID=44089 RepID=UPI0034CEEBDA